MASALRQLAERLGKDEALTLLLEAIAREEAGDFGRAIELYRRAYRLWPALDSADEDGLPTAVRREALEAGLDLAALAVSASMRLDPVPRFELAQTEDWLAYLEEFGYVVLAAVADETAVRRAHGLLWDFLEAEPGSDVRRAEPASWGGPSWPASASNGLLGGGGFGQSDFMWHLRLLPGVQRVFAEIWGCADLLTSFDGGNAFRPWRQRPEWRTEGSWWHVDDNAFLTGSGRPVGGRRCVQGLVTLTDATAETGGLCVAPGSHGQHLEICERACSAKMSGHFVPVQDADPALRHTRLVCAQAGDLVLWDSRCVHCNTPSVLDEVPASQAADAEELLRLVGYVCMTPTAWASEETLSKRRDAFVQNMSANHLPHELHGLDPAPEWMPQRDWKQVLGEQRRLVVGDAWRSD